MKRSAGAPPVLGPGGEVISGVYPAREPMTEERFRYLQTVTMQTGSVEAELLGEVARLRDAKTYEIEPSIGDRDVIVAAEQESERVASVLAQAPVGDRDGKGEGPEPPSDRELREWRSLRSLAQPGPQTLRTVYSVAFPVLLDQYDALRSRLSTALARVAELERDAVLAVESYRDMSNAQVEAAARATAAEVRVAEVEAALELARVEANTNAEATDRWSEDLAESLRERDSARSELSRLQPVVEAAKEALEPLAKWRDVGEDDDAREPLRIHVSAGAIQRAKAVVAQLDALSSPPQGSGTGEASK